MATIEELEARVAALEALQVEPRLGVPPITMGELTDVPTPGSAIASTWAQEVTNRIRHRFTSVADRDTRWPAAAAGRGAMCITTNDNMTWTSTGTAWFVMPGTVLRNASANAPDQNMGNGPMFQDILFVNMSFPVPVTVSFNVAGWYGVGGTGFSVDWDVVALTSGNVVVSRFGNTPDGTWKVVFLPGAYQVPTAGVEAGFKVRWGKGTGQSYRGAFVNYLVTAT